MEHSPGRYGKPERELMRYLTILFVLLLAAEPASAQQELYTIEGEVRFEQEGGIYVYLVTEEVFGTPFTGIQDTLIQCSQEEQREGRVLFQFEGITPGTYGIRVFQDLDGNGRLNRGMFGPTEPWGMSWQGEKPKKWPKWKSIAFEVTSDIREMVIVLK
ncbi:DUF2141 domain-containing protein [Gemmatimonadota bacterium]